MARAEEDVSLQALTGPLRAGGDGWPEPQAGPADHGGLHPGHDAAGVSTTVRTTSYEGHEIRVETTYRISVDGRPLPGHVEVLANGRVHYHGLPNYAVASTVELARLVVGHFGTTPPGPDELG